MSFLIWAVVKPQCAIQFEFSVAPQLNVQFFVLDTFCGCGMTVHAAQKLGRQWIGIDVTYLAINLIKRRLRDAFGEDVQFEELGHPTDLAGAERLAEKNKFQFQHWALSLVGARPLREAS
jgi:hypothetical protein